jgi:hypothetical protein
MDQRSNEKVGPKVRLSYSVLLLTQCLGNSVTRLFEKEIGVHFLNCLSNYQTIFPEIFSYISGTALS